MSTMQSPSSDALRHGFGGEILVPGDAAYEGARAVWNGTIDKHPAIIARCTSTADVVHAVNFARQNRLLAAVRGGGHNIAGNGTCDDGLVIDLSPMRRVETDAAARRVVVEGGALLGDVDASTQAHGLATPVGINSTTGIAGLTLGGGFGWLSRKYGLTVDNLVSAEVVTADGEVVHASADSHPDLFWALRGGGGNFGVVTRFEFRLHPVGPEVFAGLIVYPLAEIRTVLQRTREFIAGAPDDLTVWTILRQAPPLPFLPESVHGSPIVALAVIHAGDTRKSPSLIAPLRDFGTPLGEHLGAMPYVAWQQMFDPLLTRGARNYWKSHNFSELSDQVIDAGIDALKQLPSPECEVFFGALGGATERVAPDAMAYAHRDARYVMNIHARWQDKDDDVACIVWARALYEATTPFASGGVYVNFLTADEGDRVRAAYGPNYDRLVEVKRRYDPKNLFCVNQNIRPD